MNRYSGSSTRLIVFYLPQFHPIPENDAWWGTGFTEWTNVAKSTPRFSGHHQPQIPADLGFCDLRLPETRQAQADLASEHGISGFCYYHYWFNGKMLLERPFNEVLASGAPDFPFCLCWANENWTRAWDGLDREVLAAQDYANYDHLAHFAWLERAFADRRYIRIDGRPLFLIYRAEQIPRLKEIVREWQTAAREYGYPGIYLCAVKNMQFDLSWQETQALGIDALVDFQPNPRDVAKANRTGHFPWAEKVLRWLGRMVNPGMRGVYRYSYEKIVSFSRQKPQHEERVFPCVFPSWDNSSRRRTNVTVIQNDDANLYGQWLADSLKRTTAFPEGERIVFINAWNEWAEGCHLEPDHRNGRNFLNATKEAVALAKAGNSRK